MVHTSEDILVIVLHIFSGQGIDVLSTIKCSYFLSVKTSLSKNYATFLTLIFFGTSYRFLTLGPVPEHFNIHKIPNIKKQLNNSNPKPQSQRSSHFSQQFCDDSSWRGEDIFSHAYSLVQCPIKLVVVVVSQFGFNQRSRNLLIIDFNFKLFVYIFFTLVDKHGKGQGV